MKEAPLLLINDGIGRVSLGMREKGGVTGQGVKLEKLVAIDIVLCNVSRQPVEQGGDTAPAMADGPFHGKISGRILMRPPR